MAHILMLKDQSFIGAIIAQIKENVNPPQAIVNVVKDYFEKFDRLTNAYMKEKGHDVKDIGKRLLQNLLGVQVNLEHPQGSIVIAQELFPSDILKMSYQNVKGIILLSGGATSHLSILARSLEIPLVIVDVPELLEAPVGTKILLDGEQGNIYVNPGEDIILSFKNRIEEQNSPKHLKQKVQPVTKTKDGVKIQLFSNINLLSDLKLAADYKAEGIGLYRTEFPFMVRSDFPSEEEQYVIYKKLVDAMPGKEITFRTLDIGGDKVLSYYHFEKEENPFLGMRSIRFSLKHKEVFEQQIRAIVRAGHKADLRIMFPMISSVDEFLEAKEFVGECIERLKKEGIPCHDKPAVGMMVELPAVLEIIDWFAEEADFFSIGTNDFIQYMLAVDRTNEKVADLYLPHHPSILRALKKIVSAAQKKKKDVSICGDMAHEERYIPYIIGIGIRKISLDARFHPKIQEVISRIDVKEAESLVRQILSKHRISDTHHAFSR